MPSRLGDRLRELREAQGLSVEDLANAAGIDESTMQAILGGDITRPPNERLRGLAVLRLQSLLNPRAALGLDQAPTTQT